MVYILFFFIHRRGNIVVCLHFIAIASRFEGEDEQYSLVGDNQKVSLYADDVYIFMDRTWD